MLWIDYAYDLQRAVRALVELGDRAGARRRPARRRPALPRRGRRLLRRRAGAARDGLPRLLEVPARASRRPSTRCSSCSAASRCSGRCSFGAEALGRRRARPRPARPADVARGRVGDRSTCARSAARSPAARARSSATSSPSACSACPADARVRYIPPSRALSTQNSLPSGSASTIQPTSPWPMSTAVAPIARSRVDLGVLVVGDEVDVQPVLDGLRFGHASRTRARGTSFVLGGDHALRRLDS